MEGPGFSRPFFFQTFSVFSLNPPGPDNEEFNRFPTPGIMIIRNLAGDLFPLPLHLRPDILSVIGLSRIPLNKIQNESRADTGARPYEILFPAP